METMQIVSESCGVSGPEKPQTRKDKALEELALTSGSGPQENGVRVSVTTPEVDAEVSIKRIFGEGSDDVSFADKEEVVSCTVTKESEKEGSDSVLGVNYDEKNVDEKMAPKDGSLGLNGDASGGKIDCHDNGISLVVEVQGSSLSKEGHSSKIHTRKGKNLGKKSGNGDNDGSLRENEGNPGEKIKEMDGSNRKLLRHKNGEVDEDMGDGEYQYSAGDFVWGKIKSHPWWPGRIYDPKDASKYAANYSQRDRLLVAYFGDGTFAWCYPYQLKPFDDNYIEMSKQSNSRIFVKAVEEAVAEIGRHLEYKMTCSCTPKEIRIGLSRPLTVNAGVKEETVVPDGGIGKFTVAHFESSKFLSDLKCIAQVVSVSSMLEFSVLKSRMSAFFRSKGPYHQLVVYHEPQEIAGLEEKVGNGVTKSSDLGAPVEVPIQGPFEEDWLSMPISPSFGKNIRALSHKSSGSEDKLYQRRKQKSMAEIMGGNSDAEPKNEEPDMSKEDINSVKSATAASVKRGRKKRGHEAESHAVNSNSPSAQGRRKKSRPSGSPVTLDDRAVTVQSDGEGKGDSENIRATRERKKKGLSVEIDGDKLPEESELTPASRERRKSKYLCPPYTNVVRMSRNTETMGDPKAELHEVSNLAGKGERNSRATGQSISSPTTLKCNGDLAFQNNDGKELQTPKQNKVIELKGISISLQEVLGGIRSAALNPFYLREKKKTREKISGFLFAFRSAVYHDGSNYKTFNKHGPGRKRERQESEQRSLGEDVKRNDQDSSSWKQARRNRKKKKKETAAEPDGPEPELKQAAADTKTKHKENDKKVESATLFLSFGPGISLPSKDDLVKIFSKFGTLNEPETEIMYDSFCARVVFSRSSDAEEAFNSSQKTGPFGAGQVTYRLRYPSSSDTTTTTTTRKKTPDKKHGSSKKQAGKTTPGKKHGCSDKQDDKAPEEDSSAGGGGGGGGEKSQLNFIRQKLEMMTCMLERSSGKMSGEMKSNLEGEMKGLLEKVSTMAETFSS